MVVPNLPIPFFENFKSSLLSPILNLLISWMVMIDTFIRPLSINNWLPSLLCPFVGFLDFILICFFDRFRCEKEVAILF